MKQKTDQNNAYTRIMMLKSHLNLGQNDFCQRTKISTATYQRIQNQDPTVRQSTINDICTRLNANPEWVLRGDGEMFLAKDSSASVLESELYKNLRSEVEFYRNLLTHITGGKSFQMPLNSTGFSKERLLRVAA